MRRHQLSSIVAAAVWLAAVGCQQGSVGDAAPSTSVSSQSAASQASSTAMHAARPKPRRPFARHGGIGSSLFHAAHDLDLTAAQQQTLDKLEAALKADDESVRAAMTAFRADLIAGVKPGRLDLAKLAVDDAMVDKAIAEHQSVEAGALDSLHALLDTSQRANLVASIRTKMADRESRMGGWMKGRDADGGAWDPGKRRLDRLSTDLSLEPDQQKRLAAILVKASDLPDAAALQSRWEERKKRADNVLTRFATDTFEAKTLDLTVLPGKSAHEAMDHMVSFFSQLLPILYANQRDKLAESLDRPFGGGGHVGGPGAPTRSPADDIAFPFAEPAESQGEDAPANAR